MNLIHEVDLVDRTVTVGPGINMLKLNEELRRHNVFYPDDPASYPCSLVGGRIGAGGWSLLGARYGHTRENVVSMEVVLPTGEIAQIGDGGGRKLRQSLTGLNPQAAVHRPPGSARDLHRGDAQARAAARDGVRGVLRLRGLRPAREELTGILSKSGLATLAGVVLFDEWKIAYLRRDDEAYIEQPGVGAGGRGGRRCTAVASRSSPPRRWSCSSGAAPAGSTSATRSRAGDWASRHDRYAIPLHGRSKEGQAVPMSWHCEDAALNYSVLPKVREELRSHGIVARYRERYEIFDDWGMFAYTSGPYKPSADYLVEIDVGIWEQLRRRELGRLGQLQA